jgi:hypothetical protein
MDLQSSSSLEKPLASTASTCAVTSTVRNPYLNAQRQAPKSDAEKEIESAEPKPEVPSRKDESRREELSDPIEEKKEEEHATAEPPPAASSNTTSSNNAQPPNTGLAYWERLPSKNLSQESAEILTVDECVKHSAMYRGRSVRVTGQLHQRAFVGDDIETPRQVLLELIDPTAAATTQSTQTTRIQMNTPSKANTANTPGKSLPLLSASKTPNSTFKTPYKTPLKTPLKTLGPARRPGSGSVLLSSNSSTKTPRSSLLSAKRKRPWFATTTATSAKKKTPPKADPRCILKVLVDPELPGLSTIAPSGASKVMVMGVILENGSIQARFVSLADPSTDMTLYMKAIQARRRFIYRRSVAVRGSMETKQEKGELSLTEAEGETTERSSLAMILGCGPPPYEQLQPQETTPSKRIQ